MNADTLLWVIEWIAVLAVVTAFLVAVPGTLLAMLYVAVRNGPRHNPNDIMSPSRKDTPS